MKELQEPLELSAPLARRLAAQWCARDPATGKDCSWYHGFWQYLRLMGLTGTPAHHAEFYRRALAAVAGDAGPPRVLVCGVDYSMLAQVLAAFRGRAVEPAVTVVDLCDTPLHLNRWYAERAGCRIESLRCNILEFAPAARFDAVCAHAFLGFFSPAERPRLFAAWRELLRPGGVAITVNRIRPDTTGESWVGFSPEQARAFCATVGRRAETLAESLRLDPAETARAAELYASRHGTWPVRCLEEIRDLFENAGFGVNELFGAPAASGASNDLSGPAVPGTGEYLHVIASRL